MDIEQLFRSSWHFEGVHKLPPKGGTIETARFEKPKLQEFSATVPGNGRSYRLTAVAKHSERDDMIHCGLSANLYFKLMDDASQGKPSDRKLLKGYRFSLLLEQQSIVAVASVFETFVKSVIRDVKGFGHVPHNFDDISKFLKKKGINIRELGDLKNKKNYNRMKKIVDYLFLVRNLIVHNGGIIDERFRKQYNRRVKAKDLGKLIRTSHSDALAIRDWVSYLVQEICKKVPDYHDVWLDYVQSSGIVILSDLTATPTYIDMSEGPSFGLEEGR